MRLWPQSLFGRLVIILISGLLLAQVVSAVIHWRDRGQALHRAGGAQYAHRIAEIVEWLDPLAPGERENLARRLSDRRMRVRIAGRQPAPIAVDAPRPRFARIFREMLTRNLGTERVVSVMVSDRPFRQLRAERRRPGARDEVLFFVVRTALADGELAEFRFRLPRSAFGAVQRLLISLSILVASVIALALFAVRQATRPLSMLAQAAQDLGRDIGRPPLPEDKGPKEVRLAARALNVMQRRIRGFVEARTRMLAAVSHDLKTPITRLRIRAELLDDPELRASFEQDLQEMESMINETLEFMRGIDSREALQPLDLTALLESILEDLGTAEHPVTLKSTRPLPYMGRPIALKRALTNLIDNAIKYAGGAATTLSEAPDAVVIEIADRGPGIPEGQLERVFDPFYRIEGSRSRLTGGTGMGLAVARNIVQGHGGEITLKNRPECGLLVRVRLPRRRGDEPEG